MYWKGLFWEGFHRLHQDVKGISDTQDGEMMSRKQMTLGKENRLKKTREDSDGRNKPEAYKDTTCDSRVQWELCLAKARKYQVGELKTLYLPVPKGQQRNKYPLFFETRPRQKSPSINFIEMV
jgi:hypothetical protein